MYTLVCVVLLAVLVSCGGIRFKTSKVEVMPSLSEVSDSSSVDSLTQKKVEQSESVNDEKSKDSSASDSSEIAQQDSLKQKNSKKGKKRKKSQPLICTVNPGTMAGSGKSDEFRLQGNVICEYENLELKTKEAVWNRNTETVHCLGEMNVFVNGYVLTSSTGKYHRPSENILAHGNVVARDTSGEYVFSANELEYNKKTRDMRWNDNATFVKMYSPNGNASVKNVNVQKDTLSLRAQTIRYNDSLREAWAENNVVLNRGSLEVHSDKGHYAEKSQHIIMTGEPKAQLDESEMTGDTMHVDMNGEQIKGVGLQGNATGDFVERGKSSVEMYKLWGDSLYMKLIEESLEEVDIIGKKQVGKATHESSRSPGKINEMIGDSLKLSFENKNIREAQIRGNAASHYHLYDKNVYQGKNDAAGKGIRIYFSKGRLEQVQIQGTASGTYWGEASSGSIRKSEIDSLSPSENTTEVDSSRVSTEQNTSGESDDTSKANRTNETD